MPEINYPYTRCQFGVAVRDVTPPLGIYARSWGAAAHDVMDGVHRPFNATAAVFKPLDDGPTLALVALDVGWFQELDDERALRAAVTERTGLAAPQLLINMSHTHAGPNMVSSASDKPGVEFVKPHLAHMANQISDAILEARNRLQNSWVSYGYGKCSLAANRDYFDVDAQRWACGYNPKGHADDTVLVARVTDDAGNILATLVNYACHPTTLAWDNHLLSPDFIGAAREILQREFGAPALFLQGASGDLGPRDDYVGDAAVADKNGRQLGYAAASTLAALPPPASKFVYTGIKLSGADLGTWEYQPHTDAQIRAREQLLARTLDVALDRKPLPSVAELTAQYGAEPDRKEKERILRRLYIQKALGEDTVHRMPMWFWRMGDAALVAAPNELYSSFQETLRAKFPDTPLFVLGVTNGTLGYLAPRETYGKGLYQEWQSPYAAGCLETATAEAEKGVEDLFT
jgi:hypothetical protein